MAVYVCVFRRTKDVLLHRYDCLQVLLTFGYNLKNEYAIAFQNCLHTYFMTRVPSIKAACKSIIIEKTILSSEITFHDLSSYPVSFLPLVL